MLRQRSGWACARVGAWLAHASLQPGLAAEPASPAEPPVPRPDKSRYTLWNPTPRPLLRELSADRPDKTESAFTVDAGHFQVEMDLVSHTRDQSGGGATRTEAWAIAPMNLKVGLFNDVEVQLLLETYNRVRTEDRVAGTTQDQSGFGDVTLRFKQNLWGNDGGQTALAMMPFVKFPANQDHLGNQAVEGGLIFPFAAGLPRGWGLGAMAEVDFLRNQADRGYHAAFVNTVTIGRDLTKRLAGYVEFFSEISTERGSRWVGTLDVGLTYGLTANVQLDAGVNLGVTKSADDVNPFLGLTWRY